MEHRLQPVDDCQLKAKLHVTAANCAKRPRFAEKATAGVRHGAAVPYIGQPWLSFAEAARLRIITPAR